MEDYFEQIDKDGELSVLTSKNNEELNKAYAIFFRLGFEVSKETVFEIEELVEPEERPESKHYHCPVCQTEQSPEIRDNRQPCPNCKFIYFPNMTEEQILRLRIKWEERQTLLQNRRKGVDEAALKRDMEMRLRQQIRAELKAELEAEQAKNSRVKKLIMLSSVVTLIIAGFFSGWFLGGENQAADPLASAEKKGMKLLNTEDALYLANQLVGNTDAETGELTGEEVNAENSIIIGEKRDPDNLSASISSEKGLREDWHLYINERLCPLPYQEYSLIPQKVASPTCSL